MHGARVSHGLRRGLLSVAPAGAGWRNHHRDCLYLRFIFMTHPCGTFIVLDGTEGCGKSTQTALLRDRLITEGRSAGDVLLVRDPGTTRIGEQIRSILL